MVEVAGVENELSGSRNRFLNRQMREFQSVGFSDALTGIGRNVHRTARFLTGIGQEFCGLTCYLPVLKAAASRALSLAASG
jgi:hypothetical protein